MAVSVVVSVAAACIYGLGHAQMGGLFNPGAKSGAKAAASALVKMPPTDCVVVLHGLGKTSRSMWWLAKQLETDYRVVSLDYPSLSAPIAQLAETVISRGIRECSPTAGKLHFVTHSMGGILVRLYLSQHHVDALGRVVMLGPPNGGSEVVDRLNHWPVVAGLLGPAGEQLHTSENAVPNRLGAVTFELGVIAGTRSVNPILSTWIPGEDDGKVAVTHTRVEGMRDFIPLPVSHPMLMWDREVIAQVKSFLASGAFIHND